MLTKVNLIRNVGKYENCSRCPDMKQLSLIYSANARGKTTLTSIFRSLTKNTPGTILERKRLGTDNQPEIRIEVNGQNHVFYNGSWNQPYSDMFIFDDIFIENNVHSGMSVNREQRIGLHEIILGSQNVALVREVESVIIAITQANTNIDDARTNITPHTHGMLVDEFCNLEYIDDIEQIISNQDALLKQIQQAEPIRQQPIFDKIDLVNITTGEIEKILTKSLIDVEQSTIEQVKLHFSSLGQLGEQWVRSGLHFKDNEISCPFCGQDIQNNSLLQSYRDYFSQQYYRHVNSLNTDIQNILASIHTTLNLLQQITAVIESKYAFWSQYVYDLPPFPNSQPVIDALQIVKSNIEPLFQQKIQSPLTSLVVSQVISETISNYISASEQYLDEQSALAAKNTEIERIKKESQTGDQNAIMATIDRLKATSIRYSEAVVQLIDSLNSNKTRKAELETLRDQKRQIIDQQRQALFPQFQTSVNQYLRKLSADFQIENVVSDNRGSTPSIRFVLRINDTNISADQFKHTLSAGDRSTLALAYFFSVLDSKQNLQDQIVILDDPFTSMDDHRANATIQEIRHLRNRCKQLIVLSHDRRFLWEIQNNLNDHQRQNELVSIEVATDGCWTRSTLRQWDISQVEKNIYDEHHYKLREYCESAKGESRDIAPLLRMIMEYFCRVAFPAHYPPGKLLGPFRNEEYHRRKNQQGILTDHDFRELNNITDYANKFHHTTNPNYLHEIQNISDVELKAYACRVLEFTKY